MFHPVWNVRSTYLLSIVVALFVPPISNKHFENTERCYALQSAIESYWAIVERFCTTALIADFLGWIAFSKHISFRWWGRAEKKVTRLLFMMLWVLSTYGMYSYFRSEMTLRFRCWSATIIVSLCALAAYSLACPLWVLLISSNDCQEGRYLAQDDLEDVLVDLEENPITYQVWYRGRLVYASFAKADVKKFILEGHNLRRNQWAKSVIREVQL